MSTVPKDLVALARIADPDQFVVAWSPDDRRAYVFDVDRTAHVATLVHTYHRTIERKTIQQWQWWVEHSGYRITLARLLLAELGSWTFIDPRRGSRLRGEFLIGPRGIRAVDPKRYE